MSISKVMMCDICNAFIHDPRGNNALQLYEDNHQEWTYRGEVLHACEHCCGRLARMKAMGLVKTMLEMDAQMLESFGLTG